MPAYTFRQPHQLTTSTLQSDAVVALAWYPCGDQKLHLLVVKVCTGAFADLVPETKAAADTGDVDKRL